MTEAQYLEWEASAKSRHQDFYLRKSLFNWIQQDLDKNQYSLLRDTDLIESNISFLINDISLIKFKFTDLVI